MRLTKNGVSFLCCCRKYADEWREAERQRGGAKTIERKLIKEWRGDGGRWPMSQVLALAQKQASTLETPNMAWDRGRSSIGSRQKGGGSRSSNPWRRKRLRPSPSQSPSTGHRLWASTGGRMPTHVSVTACTRSTWRSRLLEKLSLLFLLATRSKTKASWPRSRRWSWRWTTYERWVKCWKTTSRGVHRHQGHRCRFLTSAPSRCRLL